MGKYRMRFAFLVAGLFFCCTAVAEPAARPYRIAVILPLSGQVASLGGYVRKGIELALEDLNPDERAGIELLFEDDEFDPKKTVSAYTALSQRKPLDAVFVLGSPTANALAPITERNKQILIAIGASDPGIVKDRRYAFVHWVIPPVLGQRLAEELLRRDFQRIAFITAEVSGALADTNAAVAALQERGAAGRVVYNEAFFKGDTDYRAVIGALKGKSPQAVVVVLFPGALSSFMKQARQLQVRAELVGMETFEDEGEVKAAEGAMLGAWYVNGADPAPDFVSRYRAKHGEHPGWASANGYDALVLTAHAASGGSEGVREHLTSLKDYRGAAGTYSASGDNRFLLPAALKQVTREGFVTITTSD